MILSTVVIAGALGAGTFGVSIKAYQEQKRKKEYPWTVPAERFRANQLAGNHNRLSLLSSPKSGFAPLGGVIGAIELVTPANKACPELAERDRAKHRRAFTSKCETYLRRGIGLVIVDLVTTRKANLHHELLRHLGMPLPSGQKRNLYSTAYRPASRAGKSGLDPSTGSGHRIWEEQLVLGQALPTMPLWLGAGLCLPT